MHLKNYIFCLFFLPPAAAIADGKDFSNIPTEVREAAQAVWQLRGAQGQGSGFFTAPRTLITNYHVVKGLSAQDPSSDIVLRQNGMQRGLKIKRAVFLSAALDIAVLETNKDAPFYLPLHNKPLDENTDLFSLGYPEHSFYVYKNLQPFSAFHNHLVFPVRSAELSGNSGGPLLTAAGEVAGMNVLAIHNFIGAVDISLLTQALEGKTGVRCQDMIFNDCAYESLGRAVQEGLAGNATAQHNLAMRQESNSEENLFWLGKAARLGHVLSQYSLGIELSDTEKTEEMTAWFKEAAAAGLVPAQYTLGLMYLQQYMNKGGGVKNYKRLDLGISLIAQAAEGDYFDAENLLEDIGMDFAAAKVETVNVIHENLKNYFKN